MCLAYADCTHIIIIYCGRSNGFYYHVGVECADDTCGRKVQFRVSFMCLYCAMEKQAPYFSILKLMCQFMKMVWFPEHLHVCIVTWNVHVCLYLCIVSIHSMELHVHVALCHKHLQHNTSHQRPTRDRIPYKALLAGTCTGVF